MLTVRLIVLVVTLTCAALDGVETRPAEEILKGLSAEERIAVQRRIEAERKLVEEETAPVILYGRVVDQDGRGVAGAVVRVNVQYGASTGLSWKVLIRRLQLSTAADGTFRMDGSIRGVSIFVLDVVKEGYEFQAATSWRRASLAEYKPDPLKPEILRVRRRGPGTFLLTDRTAMTSKPADPPSATDLFAQWKVDPTALPNQHEDPRTKHLVADLKYWAALQPGTSEYVFTIEASASESSGVQVLKEMLYIAPDRGYRRTTSVRVPLNGDRMGPVHVYLRTRRPELYARLDLTFRARPDELEVESESVANPYGERNLELDPALLELPIFGELSLKVPYTFLEGRRPERPDLARLIPLAQEAKRIQEQAELAATSHPASQPVR